MRNVPPDSDESVSETVEHFFLVNHPDTYLTHQVSSSCICSNDYIIFLYFVTILLCIIVQRHLS